MINNKLVRDIKFLVREILCFNYPTDKLLSNFFREHKKLDSHERFIVAETIYSILRNYYKITNIVAKDNELTIIGLVWTKLLKLTPSLYSAVTGIDFIQLAELEFKDDETSQNELPTWLIDLLKTHYPAGLVKSLAISLQLQAPLDLRVNIVRSSVDSIMKVLVAESLNPQLTPYSPYGIRLHDKVSLAKHKLFLDGKIEVQDESSQIAGMLLDPRRGEIIVDFCAGSGGKTLLFGMLMRNSGRIYAFDINEKRLSNLTPRLARSGLSNVYAQLISNENDLKIKRLHDKIDRVFVDAPCSGLGTLRRNPDLKFRQSSGAIAELNRKQSSILQSASKLLKVGGYLVYATCSFLPEENQIIVDKFLADNPNFIKINVAEALGKPQLKREDGCLLLLPNLHQTDGFFAALLQRSE